MHHKSTLSDLQANEVCHDNDDYSYAFDNNWEDKSKHTEDVN